MSQRFSRICGEKIDLGDLVDGTIWKMKQLKFELQISEFWIKVGQIKRIYFKNLSFFMEVDIESEKILKT